MGYTPFGSGGPLPLRQQPRRSIQKSIDISQHIKNLRLVVVIQLQNKKHSVMKMKHNRVPAQTTTGLPYLRVRKIKKRSITPIPECVPGLFPVNTKARAALQDGSSPTGVPGLHPSPRSLRTSDFSVAAAISKERGQSQ